MLNVVILWIFSCGIELGVVVLCLLPLRFILRRKVPRLFSYVLWAALPVGVVFNLCQKAFPVFLSNIADHVDETDPMIMSAETFYFLKFIWSVGSIIVLVVTILFFIRFRRYLVGSIKLRDNIYLCSRIDGAFSIGLFRPRIYLPTEIGEEYYEFILLHEQVHIKRKDIWMEYVATALLVLFWFQPILWLGYYLCMNDMEEACDETVLRTKGKDFRVAYAKALLDLAEEKKKAKAKRLVLGFGNGAIKERIRHAALYEKESPRVRGIALVVCILFMLVTIPIVWQVPWRVQAEHIVEAKGGNTLSLGIQNMDDKIVHTNE